MSPIIKGVIETAKILAKSPASRTMNPAKLNNGITVANMLIEASKHETTIFKARDAVLACGIGGAGTAKTVKKLKEKPFEGLVDLGMGGFGAQEVIEKYRCVEAKMK